MVNASKRLDISGFCDVFDKFYLVLVTTYTLQATVMKPIHFLLLGLFLGTTYHAVSQCDCKGGKSEFLFSGITLTEFKKRTGQPSKLYLYQPITISSNCQGLNKIRCIILNKSTGAIRIDTLNREASLKLFETGQYTLSFSDLSQACYNASVDVEVVPSQIKADCEALLISGELSLRKDFANNGPIFAYQGKIHVKNNTGVFIKEIKTKTVIPANKDAVFKDFSSAEGGDLFANNQIWIGDSTSFTTYVSFYAEQVKLGFAEYDITAMSTNNRPLCTRRIKINLPSIADPCGCGTWTSVRLSYDSLKPGNGYEVYASGERDFVPGDTIDLDKINPTLKAYNFTCSKPDCKPAFTMGSFKLTDAQGKDLSAIGAHPIGQWAFNLPLGISKFSITPACGTEACAEAVWYIKKTVARTP